MDIHKPKPWHGWREFLKEYGIIVLGVLTALGAEQAVEWLHWRHEVHVARDAIAFDLKRMLGSAAAQDAHTVCTARKLRDIGDVIDRAAATHRLAPMGWSGQPPTADWALQSWSALTSGQTLSHFPNREQLILSGLTGRLDRMRDLQRAETDDWATLQMLAGPGRPISDAEIAEVRNALMHARRDALSLKALARSVETYVVRSGLLSASEAQGAYREGLQFAFNTPVCRPTPPPPRNAADVLEPYLVAPAGKPGETRLNNLGVGDAAATEK